MARRAWATTALVLGAFGVTAAAQHVDSARMEAARGLVDAWGKKRTLSADIEREVAAEQSRAPGLPGDFWVGLIRELTPDTLGDFLARIYAHHLSAESMDSTSAFLRSPIAARYYYVLASSSQEISDGIDKAMSPPQKDAAPPPPVDSATMRAIRHLFALMELQRQFDVLVDSLVSGHSAQGGGMPADVMAEMMHQMSSTLVDVVIAPIYANKLSPAEIQEITTFFASPAGRRVLAAVPPIEREETVARRAWLSSMRGVISQEVKQHSGAKG